LRDPVSKATWARQNDIDPGFDLPVREPSKFTKLWRRAAVGSTS